MANKMTVRGHAYVVGEYRHKVAVLSIHPCRKKARSTGIQYLNFFYDLGIDDDYRDPNSDVFAKRIYCGEKKIVEDLDRWLRMGVTVFDLHSGEYPIGCPQKGDHVTSCVERFFEPVEYMPSRKIDMENKFIYEMNKVFRDMKLEEWPKVERIGSGGKLTITF